MANLRDVQSAELAGYTRAQELFDAWSAEFFAPAVVDYMRALMVQLTPEQMMLLRQMDPETHDRVMRLISNRGVEENGSP